MESVSCDELYPMNVYGYNLFKLYDFILSNYRNPAGEGTASTQMSCSRISKQELASSVGIVMVGLWIPPPVITPSGEVEPWPGDGLLGLRPQYSKLLLWPSFRIPDANAGRGGPDLSGYQIIER
ncbi:hypothetical protein AVEN_224852-1 [Araneus ventricosus]|uniref:Uncharacterized protein n=1 Tax=Araneus ventricosus TaxID=182803 RepID=A0A4Y2TAA2_ARAVE|nr:hypothetical protein AVEN_3982-1 [Araneus ventricosus]GBN97600.1 hypothetical protein AVEN_224852-1 [Araneus ventricosus]